MARIPLRAGCIALVLFSAEARASDVEVQLGSADAFLVTDDTGSVEHLRVDEGTGNVSRNGSLFLHTTGADNTFVGPGAGNSATSGTGGNAAIGKNALSSNTTGAYNSALGFDALSSNNIGGFNTAFGWRALDDNTTGNVNSALGSEALESNTTGFNNVAFGSVALGANTTGHDNVGIGFQAGSNQTTGSDNVYIANDGVAAESGQIKIGTAGTHTDTALVGDVSVFDASGSSSITLGGGATNGPHGVVLDDEVAGDGVQLFYRTGPNLFVLEKASTGTTGDPADAFSYDRDTDIFYLGGPVGIQRIAPTFPLQVGTDTSNGNGAYLSAGGTWTNGSSRAFKERFEAVDAEQVLARVTALPIARWHYRDSDEGPHLGPVAEDFHAAFGLGGDDGYIATIDADGVALAAIQGLHAQVERQQRTIEALVARLAALEASTQEAPAGGR